MCFFRIEIDSKRAKTRRVRHWSETSLSSDDVRTPDSQADMEQVLARDYPDPQSIPSSSQSKTVAASSAAEEGGVPDIGRTGEAVMSREDADAGDEVVTGGEGAADVNTSPGMRCLRSSMFMSLPSAHRKNTIFSIK